MCRRCLAARHSWVCSGHAHTSWAVSGPLPHRKHCSCIYDGPPDRGQQGEVMEPYPRLCPGLQVHGSCRRALMGMERCMSPEVLPWAWSAGPSSDGRAPGVCRAMQRGPRCGCPGHLWVRHRVGYLNRATTSGRSSIHDPRLGVIFSTVCCALAAHSQ